MASPSAPRRRFAPVPIETTFRKGGPTAELTPEPSPSSPSPPPAERAPSRDKRRFAPQLIESSRRSRRSGDVGPATRPTDKTDITPYKNHIYAPKPKKKTWQTHRKIESLSRRESCDDEVAGRVFDLAAKEAEMRMEEIAMYAFPNAGVRTGGAEHFFAREGSEDESSQGSRTRGRSAIRHAAAHGHARRDSSEEDVGWATREMQEHHEHMSELRKDRLSSADLDKMSFDAPPDDLLWNKPRQSSEENIRPIGESFMPFIPSQPLPTIGENTSLPSGRTRTPSPPPIRPIGEYQMPYIPSAPPGKAADMPYEPVSSRALPAETGFGRNRGIFASPYADYGYSDPTRDLDLMRLRNRASPPMLGKDLTFRSCPSPKQTKLEPDHLWNSQEQDEANRDVTGQHGLWNGYCYSAHKDEALAPIIRPSMLATPMESSTPSDPFDDAFGRSSLTVGSSVVSREPESVAKGARLFTAKPRNRGGEPKGLHMLGLEERLKKEKEKIDREEKIAAEFTDKFVSQVYNYLSLGYPATARSYDEELSKIGGISVDELEKEDDNIIQGIGQAKGHISLEISTDESEGSANGDAEEKCPRWQALRQYIFEWARQHPDLDSISPLAWGVRERRGSWGL